MPDYALEVRHMRMDWRGNMLCDDRTTVDLGQFDSDEDAREACRKWTEKEYGDLLHPDPNTQFLISIRIDIRLRRDDTIGNFPIWRG